MNPIVTVITICYNVVDTIRETIVSVINQQYDNLEYILIDGGSNDGTLGVIYEYKKYIKVIVSEKDDGIYDAMNKGINLSSGEWLNFMNAGDKFVNEFVLLKVFSHNKDFILDKALLYGNKIQDNKIVYPLPLKSLELGEIMANHQSMFFNKKLLGLDLFYDLNYPIYADYELVLKIYKRFGDNFFFYLNINVASYEGNGLSSFVSTQKRKDRYKIVFKYLGFYGVVLALKNWFFPIRKS